MFGVCMHVDHVSSSFVKLNRNMLVSVLCSVCLEMVGAFLGDYAV